MDNIKTGENVPPFLFSLYKKYCIQVSEMYLKILLYIKTVKKKR